MNQVIIFKTWRIILYFKIFGNRDGIFCYQSEVCTVNKTPVTYCGKDLTTLH